MGKVTHFEIMAYDPEKVLSFYSEAFGWKSQKWDGPEDYWLLDGGECEGINGGVGKRQENSPGVVNTIGVDALEASIEKVQSAGGTIAMPKMAVPGIGWLAYGVDPEGNMFGMMQMDESAA